MIELTHSKKLSKRVRKDKDLKKLLFPKRLKILKLEEGVLEIKCSRSDYTIFSKNNSIDTDEELEKFLEDEEIDKQQKAILNRYKFTQSVLEVKRLVKLKWYKRKVIQKPLSNKRNPRIMQEIRFFDYSFPLDSRIFADTFDNKSKKFNLPHNVYDHKRALSVTLDKEKSLFSIEVGEKVLSSKDLVDYSLSLQNYYIKWLRNSGNAKALPFIEIQLEHNGLDKNFANKESELAIYENIDLYKYDKFFLKKISKSDMEFISKSPYMTRTHKRNLLGTNQDNNLIQEEFNMELCKLIGYQDTDVDEILSKSLRFDVQNSMYCKNFINGMCNLKEVRKQRYLSSYRNCQTDSTGSKILEKVYIRTKDKEKSIGCTIIAWKENWIENGCLYNKVYKVFTDADEEY